MIAQSVIFCGRVGGFRRYSSPPSDVHVAEEGGGGAVAIRLPDKTEVNRVATERRTAGEEQSLNYVTPKGVGRDSGTV